MNHAEQDEQRHQERIEVTERDMQDFSQYIFRDLEEIKEVIQEMRRKSEGFENIDTDAIIKERVGELLS